MVKINNEVFVCPDCGSPLVEFSMLSSGAATCKVCPWTGTRETLAAIPFQTEFSGSEDTLNAIRNDVRVIVREMTPGILKLLIRWGFVEAVQLDGKIVVKNKQQVVRYMNAIASHFLIGIIEERKKIEVERVRGN